MIFFGLKEYSIKALCAIDEQLNNKLLIYKKMEEEELSQGKDISSYTFIIEKLENDIEFIKVALIDRYKKEELLLHDIIKRLKKSKGSNYLALQKVFVYRACNFDDLIVTNNLLDVIDDFCLDDVVDLANYSKNFLIRNYSCEIARSYQGAFLERFDEERGKNYEKYKR